MTGEPLQRQWENLRDILDAVPAFIWYKDCDNRIIRVNRPAAESMGLAVADIEGMSTYELYPEEAAQYHRDDLDVISSGVPKLRIVEPLQMASGEKRWVRTDKVPHFDANGVVVGVIVFAVDITERVLAEETLRAAAVVRRLRDFVRKETSHRQEYALAEILGEALQMVEADAARKDITLRLHVAPGLPRLELDRIQIEQVIVNLVGNAIDAFDSDARDAKREVAIDATERADGMIAVRVSGNGKGLPAGDSRAIFEPFFTTKDSGLGMGLSISESIVVSHGGTLQAETNAAGGATLTFTLPQRTA